METESQIKPIDPVGVRVLGSLIEKEITTPDNYPLTLNALIAACNQTTNRDPVLALDEHAVLNNLDELTKRTLVRAVHRSDSRAKRYRQVLSESMNLHPAETAVMCVLMLRGPQTTGELRTRTARMFEFVDLTHVEVTLQALATLTAPLVMQMQRRPGQKEVRFAHLLSGEPASDALELEAAPAAPTIDRIAELAQAVDALRAELAQLRDQFDEFKRQFQ